MTTTVEHNPADSVAAGVERILELAATWVHWDGRARLSEDRDRIYTPHKALRRHADHLVDHLAEVHALLAGVPTEADGWHASAVTVAADWATFGPADLNEAEQRLGRLARTYQLAYAAAGPAAWDASREPNWTLRRIAEHVGPPWYAEQVGDLTADRDRHPLDDPRRAEAELIYTEWDRRARAGDAEGLVELYAEDATLESPLVARILDQDHGIVRGKDQLRAFFVEGARRRPNPLVRWHRGRTFLYDGTNLVWEYPRATPDGDQIDIAEIMQLEAGRITAHRIYWGWFGTEMLIANATSKAAASSD